MQVFVGDDVIIDALLFEPGEDVGVGIDVPHWIRLGAHLAHWSQPRGIPHATAVGMVVVGRQSVFRVLLEEDFPRLHRGPVAFGHFAEGLLPGPLDVGIGHVGDRRRQKGEPRRGGVARRADIEGQVPFIVISPQAHRIDAAAQVCRDLVGEVGFPCRIVEVVVVKVDGAVLFGCVAPVLLAAAPVEALDRAGRQVDHPTMKAVGAGVDGHDITDVAGEVPGGDHRRIALVGHGVPAQGDAVGHVQCATDQPRPVELAVEEVAGAGPPRRMDRRHRRHDQRPGASHGRCEVDGAGGTGAGAGFELRTDKVLGDGKDRLRRIIGGANQMPAPLRQRPAGGDFHGHAATVSQTHGRGTAVVNGQGETTGGGVVPV